MPLLLLVIFVVVPLAELYVIIQVGQAIGVLPTIALLLLDSLLGTVLMRSQGRAAWRRFNAALTEGRAPAREVLDGVLVIFGGAFLLTPGFITDVFGILFLLPPTRAVVRRLLMRNLAARIAAGAASWTATRAAWRRGPLGPRGGDRSYDVDGTAVERDQEQLP